MQRIGGIGGDGHDEGLGIRQGIYAIPLLMRYYRMTTGELSKCFSHPLLRKFISAFWGNEFGSLALLMVFAAFCGENGGIPAGGSCGMAKRMEKQFAALGGEVLCDREVIRINRRGALAESVDLSDGTRLTADYVVVTCDPFGRLSEVSSMRLCQKDLRGNTKAGVLKDFPLFNVLLPVTSTSCRLREIIFFRQRATFRLRSNRLFSASFLTNLIMRPKEKKCVAVHDFLL